MSRWTISHTRDDKGKVSWQATTTGPDGKHARSPRFGTLRETEDYALAEAAYYDG